MTPPDTEIMEEIESYNRNDDQVTRSHLITKLKRLGLFSEGGGFSRDTRSIEEKIDAIGEVLTELMVERWENGELTDEELADRIDPFLG